MKTTREAAASSAVIYISFEAEEETNIDVDASVLS
jgi:hypothetical protein